MFTSDPRLYFDDLYSNTSDLIQYVGLEGTIQAVNPSWLRRLGYSSEAVIGKSIFDFVIDEDRERFLEYRRQVVAGKNVEEIEFRFATGNGRHITVEGHLRPFFKKKALVHTRGVFRDISYRKERELSFTSAFQRLASFLAYAPSAIVVIDEQQHILEWNFMAEELFGWKRDEVLNQRLAEFIIPAAFREAHHQGMRRFIETGQGPVLNKTIEVPAINRSLHEFPISLKISASQVDGQWYFIAFMNDLTQQRLSEQKSQQAMLDLATAKEQGALYKEFLSLASHELKTPVTSILALSQIAERELERGNSHSIAKSIEGIGKHSRKLGTLINQLMDVSRIQSGKLILEPEYANLNEFLAHTVASLQTVYPTHRIQLENESEPVWLEFDPLRLEQVLNNLVSNAVKYSPDKDLIELICRKKQNQVEIMVVDYGIGIESGLKHQVFEKFYQIDNIMKADKSGLGVGLHISSEIIKYHGGSIWVESEPGVKTTFTLTLPLQG